MMTTEQAVRTLRHRRGYDRVLREAYLGGDLEESGRRFERSGEFREVLSVLGDAVQGAVLDVGAGNGIASRAFARAGARTVYALEPDQSDEVGGGAIRRLTRGLPVEVIAGYGERIALGDGVVDVVYARSVLHHTQDLPGVLRECARVLRPGGIFLACREHVVDDEAQLRSFLRRHPLHRFTGGENAFPLKLYVDAITASGLTLERVYAPWENLINAYPFADIAEQLSNLPAAVLEYYFGKVGRLVAMVPGSRALVWRALRRPYPGRLYSFLARKPP